MRAVTKGEEVLLVLDVLLALWAEAVGVKDRWVAEPLYPMHTGSQAVAVAVCVD